MAERLTGRLVDAVLPNGAKQLIPDAAMPGLFLRVTPRGAKAFVLRRQHEGARIEHTIGKADDMTPEMARAKAAEVLSALKINGVNPSHERAERIRQERVAKTNTVASLVEGYLTNQDPAKSRRSIDDERYRFERYILPRIGRTPYADLTRADLVLVIREIGAEVGGPTANRCHQYLSQLLNYALNGGAIAFNPIAGLPKQFREQRRARSLSDQELALIWFACEAGRKAPRNGSGAMPRTARAMQIVMLTLQRGHQVREMRRGDISLARKEWIVPAERMKNRQRFLVPLSDPACEILAEALSASRDEHVFSNNRRDEPLSENALNHLTRRVLLDNGCDSAGPHDIRRTGRTLLTSKRVGVSRDVAERVIAHIVGSDVERRYDLNDYADEKREAMDRWAKALLEIVGPYAKSDVNV